MLLLNPYDIRRYEYLERFFDLQTQMVLWSISDAVENKAEKKAELGDGC